MTLLGVATRLLAIVGVLVTLAGAALLYYCANVLDIETSGNAVKRLISDAVLTSSAGPGPAADPRQRDGDPRRRAAELRAAKATARASAARTSSAPACRRSSSRATSRSPERPTASAPPRRPSPRYQTLKAPAAGSPWTSSSSQPGRRADVLERRPVGEVRPEVRDLRVGLVGAEHRARGVAALRRGDLLVLDAQPPAVDDAVVLADVAGGEDPAAPSCAARCRRRRRRSRRASGPPCGRAGRRGWRRRRRRRGRPSARRPSAVTTAVTGVVAVALRPRTPRRPPTRGSRRRALEQAAHEAPGDRAEAALERLAPPA